MKAAWLESFGGPEALQYGERPDPRPGAGEALVRVKACSLNHLDVWVRRGKSFPRPLIPGSDIVGVVEELGPGAEGVRVGQEVIAFPCYAKSQSIEKFRGYYPLCEDFQIFGAHRDGGCAERVAVPAAVLLEKPASVAWFDAACLPIAFLTAWHMLFARGSLKAGETVLVQSAGSGVGHAAIQMARHAGANVIATTGSPDKALRARELGADCAIDYTAEDVVARVHEITSGRGADVVIDHNGAKTWKSSIDALAKGGRLIVCGTTQGAEVSFDLGRFFYAAQSVLGSTLGTAADLHEVIQLVALGRIKPVIDRAYPLSQIREAHERLAAPDRFGKVVVYLG